MKIFTRWFVALVVLLSALQAAAAKPFVSRIQLGQSSALVIRAHDDRRLAVTLEIVREGAPQDRVTIANAMVDAAHIVRGHFCAACEDGDAIFIRVPDRSSTYGATTGVLAWQDGWGTWRLQVLPFSVADVEDVDNDGVLEIFDRYRHAERIYYRFENGLLQRK